ncbi:MFS transporter [Hutsoniella sourekii]
MSHTQTNKSPWLAWLSMASVVFLAIVSELLPSGLLTQMSQGLNASPAQIGNLVGLNSLPAGILAIPVTQLVAKYNRKYILMGASLLFALANLILSQSQTYALAVIARLISGSAAGLFWPLIASYASRTVAPDHSGRAVTIVLSGSTIGLSLGLPLFTWLGQMMGWRAAFLLVAGLFLTLTVLGYFTFMSVPGEVQGDRLPLGSFFKNRGIQVALQVVVLLVMAQYSTYVYMQLITARTGNQLQVAQIIFGLGAITAVTLVARYIDKYLRYLFIAAFSLGIFAMLSFLSGQTFLSYMGMFAWGMSYGPISSLLQNLTMGQVKQGKDVAASIQTFAFDFSIMAASLFGGFILEKIGLQANLSLAIGLFAIGLVIVNLQSRFFKR